MDKLVSQNMLIGVQQECMSVEPEQGKTIEVGDHLVFFTDGLPETSGADGQLLGEDQLIELAMASHCRSAANLADLHPGAGEGVRLGSATGRPDLDHGRVHILSDRNTSMTAGTPFLMARAAWKALESNLQEVGNGKNASGRNPFPAAKSLITNQTTSLTSNHGDPLMKTDSPTQLSKGARTCP